MIDELSERASSHSRDAAEPYPEKTGISFFLLHVLWIRWLF